MNNRTFDIKDNTPTTTSLWDGQHKIPWNDPAFSARMLKEHLSQDHDLASRKQQSIKAQATWISSRFLCEGPARILDLGCGPGLYSRLLAGETHQYQGIDFSPASINYATQEYSVSGRCEFRLDDVVKADFGGPYDLAMMLYGEINVFPPANCQSILSKAYAALDSGGTLVLEPHHFETVRGIGQTPNTQTAAEGGLFSDSSYVCLTESSWYEAESTAQQVFNVRAENDADSKTYKSTTKAWTQDELILLLKDAGFTDVVIHDDWPNPSDAFLLLTAHKK